MTTAAADPWIEAEDADDFWDDDLGSINDDGWDDGDATRTENLDTASAPPVEIPEEIPVEGSSAVNKVEHAEPSEQLEEKGDESKEIYNESPADLVEADHVSNNDSSVTVSGLENEEDLNAEAVPINASSTEAESISNAVSLEPSESDEVLVQENVNPLQGIGQSEYNEVHDSATLVQETELEGSGDPASELAEAIGEVPVSPNGPSLAASDITVNKEDLVETKSLDSMIPRENTSDILSAPTPTVNEDVQEVGPIDEATEDIVLLMSEKEVVPKPESKLSSDPELASSEPKLDVSDELAIEEPSKTEPKLHNIAGNGIITDEHESELPSNGGLDYSNQARSLDSEIQPDVSLTSQPTSSETHSEVEALRSQIRKLQIDLEAKNSLPATKSSASDATIEAKLAEVEKERDDAKSQLEGFLSKISSMKTVFRNYKITQEELEASKQEVALLKEKSEALEQDKLATEEENLQLLVAKEQLEKKVSALEFQAEKLTKTILELKSNTGDLNSECERLSLQLSSLRREFSSKDETLQDEKYALENEVSKLSKKINELKSSYSELEIAKEDVIMENKNLLLVIEEVRGSLETKKKEEEKFEGILEKTKTTYENEKKLLESRIHEIESEFQQTQLQLTQIQEENTQLLEKVLQSEEKCAKFSEENEKITQLQEDIHSKQVIIGKLRHEAVILNEHLTKSLSMLKQNLGDSEQTVDKELVSNLIVKFVQIPRGDTKKFETLSLIAGLLDWDEKRKMEAGLVNSGAKAGEDGRPARLSIISLWTDFLDKESKNKT